MVTEDVESMKNHNTSIDSTLFWSTSCLTQLYLGHQNQRLNQPASIGGNRTTCVN